jgi:hypothetical protein
MSVSESDSSKKEKLSLSSNDVEEDEEKNDKINENENENDIENQSLIFEADKNNTNNKNNANKANNNSVNDNENNSKKNAVKESRESNRKLSLFLNSQKEGNKILKEYDEIIKCDEEDKIKENKDNKHLIKKIKELEEKLSSSNKIINDLTNNKDSLIQRLTNTNKKLKNSLEIISKKMDEKIMNANLFKKLKANSRNKIAPNLSMNSNANTRSIFSGQNNLGKGSHFSDDVVSKNNNNKDMVKEKELNNAVSLIKILKNDNKDCKIKLMNLKKIKNWKKSKKNKNKRKLIENYRNIKCVKKKWSNTKIKLEN